MRKTILRGRLGQNIRESESDAESVNLQETNYLVSKKSVLPMSVIRCTHTWVQTYTEDVSIFMYKSILWKIDLILHQLEEEEYIQSRFSK